MRKQSLPLLLTALLGLTWLPGSASAANFMNPFEWFKEMFDNDDDDDYYRDRYYRDRYFAPGYGAWGGPWGYGPWQQGQNWQANNSQPAPEHIPE